MSIVVIDNFLPDKTFYSLQEAITGTYFDWYYNDYIDRETDVNKGFQFIHFFYKDNINGSRFNIIEPILNVIKPTSLLRIKANLLTKTNNIVVNEFHKDFNNVNNLTTAIFYINSCNGYTLFKDGTKIQSVSNRFVSFDSQLEHTGTSCTDNNRRILINFNYFTKND
jgi:hypothetical protein